MVLDKFDLDCYKGLITKSDANRPASRQMVLDMIETIEAQEKELKIQYECVGIFARKVEKLKNILKQLEWIVKGTNCPMCGYGKGYGHKPDCKFAELLKDGEGIEPK